MSAQDIFVYVLIGILAVAFIVFQVSSRKAKKNDPDKK